MAKISPKSDFSEFLHQDTAAQKPSNLLMIFLGKNCTGVFEYKGVQKKTCQCSEYFGKTIIKQECFALL